MTTALCSEKNWPTGLNIKRYPDGQIKSRQFFVEGKRYGTKTRWNADGSIYIVRSFFADLLHGKQEIFLPDHIQVQWYVHDKRSGVWTSHDYKKRLLAQTEFFNDVKHGHDLAWWPDGEQRTDYTWINGQLNGRAIDYFTDGTVREDGYWQFGKRHGLTRCYNEFEVLVESTEFKQGKKHGNHSYYDSDGDLQAEGTFFEDNFHGLWRWRENGGPITACYSHGKRISQQKMKTIKRFLKRCKFYRLAHLVKTPQFNEWFFSPEAPGGQLAVARLTNSKQLI